MSVGTFFERIRQSCRKAIATSWLPISNRRHGSVDCELLQEALDNLHQGLCMFDPQGRALASNKLYAEIHGIPPEAIRPGITVSELLELPDLVYPAFGLCLGWPDQDPEVKPRMPVDMILHRDRYHAERVDADVERYDDMMCEYYAARSENRRSSGWSAPTANAVQGKTRAHMLAFLQKRGFLKR